MNPEQMADVPAQQWHRRRRRVGALRRARPAGRRSSRRSSARCRSPSAAARRHRRAARAGAAERCRCRRGERCRRRRPSAGILGRSRRATAARSPTASSRPRPTSRSRPTSAAGSTAAASSTAPSAPTCSASEKVVSAQRWAMSPQGQHIELGIAENNLFLLLAALGLSHRCSASRLLPIGTLYDPFIKRGLDALNYACYQDARFILVATPSGITLAPEGGAHQSVGTPLIGMAQHGPRRLRAGLCRRARGDHGLGLRLHAARRQRPGRRQPMVPRRERRLGLSPPVDAAGRAAGAQHRRRARATRSSPAAIGCAAGARRRARDRLLRRGRPRGARRAPRSSSRTSPAPGCSR